MTNDLKEVIDFLEEENVFLNSIKKNDDDIKKLHDVIKCILEDNSNNSDIKKSLLSFYENIDKIIKWNINVLKPYCRYSYHSNMYAMYYAYLYSLICLETASIFTLSDEQNNLTKNLNNITNLDDIFAYNMCIHITTGYIDTYKIFTNKSLNELNEDYSYLYSKIYYICTIFKNIKNTPIIGSLLYYIFYIIFDLIHHTLNILGNIYIIFRYMTILSPIYKILYHIIHWISFILSFFALITQNDYIINEIVSILLYYSMIFNYYGHLYSPICDISCHS